MFVKTVKKSFTLNYVNLDNSDNICNIINIL